MWGASWVGTKHKLDWEGFAIYRTLLCIEVTVTSVYGILQKCVCAICRTVCGWLLKKCFILNLLFHFTQLLNITEGVHSGRGECTFH